MNKNETADFIKSASSNSKINNNTQYQYSYVDLEIVISNPNEYIILECLPACKILWDKNVETFMVSNNGDDNLYVLLYNLSPENETFLQNMIKIDSRFIYSSYRKAYGIAVKGKDERAKEELASLANMLHIQDTKRFKSTKSYLEEFKRRDGEYTVDEFGYITRMENPKLSNITLEEALKQDGKQQLYVAEENRIYDSIMYLNWHKRYMQTLNNEPILTSAPIQPSDNLEDFKPKF